MKFLLSVFLTAVLSFLLQLFLPWWSLAIAAFVIGAFISTGAFISFAGGLLGTGIVWWVCSWMIDVRTQSILTEKIAQLFQVGSPVVLILVTGLIAGIVGGFAALSGNRLRKLF